MAHKNKTTSSSSPLFCNSPAPYLAKHTTQTVYIYGSYRNGVPLFGPLCILRCNLWTIILHDDTHSGVSCVTSMAGSDRSIKTHSYDAIANHTVVSYWLPTGFSHCLTCIRNQCDPIWTSV